MAESSTKIVGGTRLSVPTLGFRRPPHRDLSAGLWEEKVTVFGRKNRLNS